MAKTIRCYRMIYTLPDDIEHEAKIKAFDKLDAERYFYMGLSDEEQSTVTIVSITTL